MKTLLVLVIFVIEITVLQVSAFDCGDQLGPVPNPDDCSSFYLCSLDGTATLEHCHEEEMFDDLLLICNYDYAVDCGERPRPGGSTTTTTPIYSTSGSTMTPGSTTTTVPESTTTTVPESTTTVPGSTTTTISTTTTNDNGYHLRFPDKVVGLYVVLADDTEDGYHTDDEWEPKLYPYQQDGANVLFFTFINPESMKVPKSFEKLAKTRGTRVEGAVPSDTVIMFAIGGQLYSQDYNPWHWLTSKEAAEAMAIEVATWPDRYGCDGLDFDIEEGAGGRAEAGPNFVHFVNKLRTIKPEIIIGQPTYGFPAIQAEIDVINESWDKNGNLKNIADAVGIMVYTGTESLRYVKNFVEGAEQWEGFPIKVNVNSKAVLVGCRGIASPATISKLAEESVKQDLLGIMVWYASVQNGLQYGISWDASMDENSMQGYIDALKYFKGQ